MLVCVFLNIPLSKPQVGSNSLLDLMNHICIHCLRGPASAQLCFSAYKILNQVLFFVHREKCVGPDQAQHLVHFLDRSGRVSIRLLQGRLWHCAFLSYLQAGIPHQI